MQPKSGSQLKCLVCPKLTIRSDQNLLSYDQLINNVLQNIPETNSVFQKA